MSNLLPEIDEQRTLANVRHYLLTDFPRLQRMAHLPVDQLRSPTMDGMPKARLKVSHAETPIINRLDAQNMVQATANAINACSANSRYILTKVYIRGRADTAVYLEMHLGRSQYFAHKQTALLEFAFAFQADYDLVVEKT